MNELRTMVEITAALERLRIALVLEQREARAVTRSSHVAAVTMQRLRSERSKVNLAKQKAASSRERDALFAYKKAEKKLAAARRWLDRLLLRVTAADKRFAAPTLN